jgi:hypothetical protein
MFIDIDRVNINISTFLLEVRVQLIVNLIVQGFVVVLNWQCIFAQV